MNSTVSPSCHFGRHHRGVAPAVANVPGVGNVKIALSCQSPYQPVGCNERQFLNHWLSDTISLRHASNNEGVAYRVRFSIQIKKY